MSKLPQGAHVSHYLRNTMLENVLFMFRPVLCIAVTGGVFRMYLGLGGLVAGSAIGAALG